MRATFSALVVVAGLVGFGAGAQAAPLSASMPAGAVEGLSDVQKVQMMTPMERRMMRREMMRREIRRDMRRDMRRREMRREIRRDMRRGM